MSVQQRLTPTLFDKLVGDLDMSGMRDETQTPEIAREDFRRYSVPKLDRFNEAALRATIRRELAWLLNTSNLESSVDLERYPHVQASVLNYGLSDLSGKSLGRRTVLQRAREIRKAIRVFEPRLDKDSLSVEPADEGENVSGVTFLIHGDITAAARAMPVKFRTEVEAETAAVSVRE